MSFTRTLRAIAGAAMAGALLLGIAPTVSADQTRDNQWPLKAFKAQEIWKISSGRGVTVAVIDNGVDANHPDLKRNVVAGKDFIDGGDPAPVGETDHGTNMAGIIAAHGHGPNSADGVKGLAPEAKIMPIRDKGNSQQGLLPAVRYAVDHGASVINISQLRTPSLEDRQAIAYAWKHDALIVAGSGNRGNGPDEEQGFPAAYPGVLAVGGVTNAGEIWEKSNYGPWITLTAPATNITSTSLTSSSSPYSSSNGTSNATAYVSATAALLRAKYPDLTAGQIANRMVKTAGLPASAKGLKLPDQKYGYGFVQPLAALKADIPAGPKSGPLKTPELVVEEAKAAAADKKARKANEKEDLRPLAAGLGVVVLLVIVAVVILVIKRKKNSGGWGGPGAAGYPPQQPGPYQQQPVPPGGQHPQQPSGPPNQPPSGW